MELDQRIHQMSKRGRLLIRAGTMRIASLSIEEGNTDLSSFYDTVINQPQRAGKKLWRSSGEEKFVEGQQAVFQFHALWIGLHLWEFSPIYSTG